MLPPSSAFVVHESSGSWVTPAWTAEATSGRLAWCSTRCSGERPFQRSFPVRIRTAMVTHELRPLPDTIPIWLRRLVERALALVPSERFADCAEFAAAGTVPKRANLGAVANAIETASAGRLPRSLEASIH
jgi:hypothetical protein